MTTVSQSVWRWCVASAVLVVLGAGSAWAKTPLSVRVIGGFTGALEQGVAYETVRVTPVLGFGVRYSLTQKHSVLLDFEGMRRWSGDADQYNWLVGEPLNRRLSSYSLSLGYQYTPWTGLKSLSPYLLAEIARAKHVLDVEGREYGFLDPGLGYPVSIPSERHSYWSNGLLFGLGCAANLSGRFSVSGAMLYRYLHDPHVTNTTGRADTRQNQNGISLQRSGFDTPDWSSLSGLEGKIVLEMRL